MSDIKKMQEVADEWVSFFIKRDLDGAAGTFLEDGAVFYADGQAHGREEIRSTYAEWFKDGVSNEKIEVIDARIAGDVAYYIARYSTDYPNEDGSTYTDTGVVVAVYHKEPDGKWRCKVASLNGDTPQGTE